MIRRESAGLVPAVEIATLTGPRVTTAGMMKPQSCGRSATLRSTPEPTASAAIVGVDRLVVGRGERQRGAGEIAAAIGPRVMHDLVGVRERGERRGQRRGDDGHARARRQQALDLPLRDLAAADHDARPPLEIEIDGEILHAANPITALGAAQADRREDAAGKRPTPRPAARRSPASCGPR